MIALIRKDEGGVYATNILAILQKGRNRQVVAFTEDYCHVKRFPVWKMKRNVYVLGGNFPEDRAGDWCGYKSVIEDEELLKAVKKHPENIDRLDGDLCALAAPPAIMEWHDIGCLKDTYYLTSLASNFFAAKILRCSHEGDLYEFVFECRRTGILTLRLSGITHDSVFKGESAVTEDELVKMKTPNVDIFYTETKEILFALDTRCVQCKKMKWKIEVES